MDIRDFVKKLKKSHVVVPAEKLLEEVNRRIQEADPTKQSVLDELKGEVIFEEVGRPFCTGLFLDENIKKIFAARHDRYHELESRGESCPSEDPIYSILDSRIWEYARTEFKKFYGFNPKWIGIRENFEIAIPMIEADSIINKQIQ